MEPDPFLHPKIKMARNMAITSLLSTTALPIVFLVFTIFATSPRAVIPLDGCFEGIIAFSIASFFPFGFSLYAISLFNIGSSLATRDCNTYSEPPKWILSSSQTIYNITIIPVGFVYVLVLIMVVETLFLPFRVMSYNNTTSFSLSSKIILRPLIYLVFIGIASWIFRLLYRKRYEI